ncbi:MAG: flavodoxin domain-containing protein [Caulobacteraceae bacterium]
MKALVAYATTEGQTRKIAEFVAQRLRAKGAEVECVDLTSAQPDPAAFDAVLLAGSLHIGKYQAALADHVHGHADALNGMQTAFLAVSLAAAGDDEDDVHGREACAARFLAETGWKPAAVHHVAGAFRFTQYDFFKRMMMKKIAREKGVNVDAKHDLELTDWDDLVRFVDGFAGA